MDKKYFPLVVAAVISLIFAVAGIYFWFSLIPSFLKTASAQLQAVPLASPAPSPQPLSTPTVTPTQTPLPSPTPTPTLVTGSVWSVTKIENNAYTHDGFVYDVATFTNIETGKTLMAHCAQPQWPSPLLGMQYRLNQVGVLIPVNDKLWPRYQRFIVLSH